MFAPTVWRPLIFSVALALAALACSTSEVSIPATATVPSTATSPPTATLAPTLTPTPTATQPTVTPSPAPHELVQIPIPDGAFDLGLGGWDYTDPNNVTWQDGYVRLNAGTPGGAALARDLEVPAASHVLLRFRYRSSNVAAGDCRLEPRPGDVRAFPADNQWRAAEVDFTPEAGTVFQVGISAHSGGACDWIDVDDFYWLVPAVEAPPTPAADGSAPTPTLAAIPESYEFTQAFSVSAEGDFPAGPPAALNDGQPATWASLRNGRGLWQFDLGRARSVASLRLLAVRDGDEDTTLLSLDISFDGSNWVTVYTPDSQCGEVPNCRVIAQDEPVDLLFGPVDARHLRLRGGPTRFALAEVYIAVLP